MSEVPLQSAPVCAPPLSCLVTSMQNGSMVSESTQCDAVHFQPRTLNLEPCTHARIHSLDVLVHIYMYI